MVQAGIKPVKKNKNKQTNACLVDTEEMLSDFMDPLCIARSRRQACCNF